MNFLLKSILTVWLGIGSLFGFHQSTPVPKVLGDYNVSGGGSYRLQSSISTTQNTVTLTSFKEPVSNISYTMSYLNSTIEYGTIDPQNNTSKEFISFSGIVQNNDGTATLTGVVRGLAFSYPFTASSTLAQPHSGQSIFILSNPPQLYNQFYNLNNVSTSTNVLIFSSTTPPRLDSVAVQASGTYIATTSEFVTWAGLQAVTLSGATNATEVVKGISELATVIEQASSTALGGTGASLVTQAKYSTSTPIRGCDGTAIAGALCSVIARNNGTLFPNWIGTSTLDTYNFAGPFAMASSSMTATTSISANSLTNGIFSLNGVGYKFPATRGASSTTLTENGSGTLTWLTPQNSVLFATTTPSALPNTTSATTTIATYVMPANTLNGINQILRIKTLMFTNSGSGSSCFYNVIFGTGAASTTISFGAINSALGTGVMDTTLSPTTTTSELGQSFSTMTDDGAGSVAFTAVNTYVFSKYATVPLTAQSYLAFSARTNGPNVCGVSGITIERISQ